jgi:cytochrome b561
MSEAPAAESYSRPAKLLHWLTAIAVIAAIALGIAMNNFGDRPLQARLYDLHRSTGALILVLTGFRLIWRLFHQPPAMVPGMPAWQARAATMMHWLLYLILFALPLIGWAGTSAYGAQIIVYGLFELPPLLAENEPLSKVLLETHQVLGFTLTALLIGHIGAALHHHFVVRDGTLRRMWPGAALRDGGRPPRR